MVKDASKLEPAVLGGKELGGSGEWASHGAEQGQERGWLRGREGMRTEGLRNGDGAKAAPASAGQGAS